jgi:MurNAc alpha-1-phosphate uridylyltransferase
MKGMILTAGLGTRLKPLTDKTPKPLLKVGDYNMLDYSIAFLRKHGIEEIIINVHHLADQLMEYVMEQRWNGLKIEISDETSELMNTGGGLVMASWFFKGEKDFVLMSSDILTDLDLTAMIHQHIDSDVLATLAVKDRKTTRDLMFDSEGLLAGWKNNQTGETKMVAGKNGVISLGFSAVHIISTSIFEKFTETGAFSITDAYLRLAETEKIKAFNHSDGKWLEFGRIENIENAIKNPDFGLLVGSLGL